MTNSAGRKFRVRPDANCAGAGDATPATGDAGLCMDDVLDIGDITLSGVPEGLDAKVLAERVRQLGVDQPGALIHVVRDDRRLEQLEQAIAFYAPKLRVVSLPAWDTVPYDRVSPSPDIVARRITSLSKLVLGGRKEPTIVLATVNAVLQRLPPPAYIRAAMKKLAPGQRMDLNRLAKRLQLGGYSRTGTVMDPGDFAVRGGIVDVYPPGRNNPVRFDFFGDTLETIKSFDAATQKTSRTIQKMILMPISEIAFGEDAIERFRTGYISLFGGNTAEDALYQAVTAGHRHPGMEHWLPLFHDGLATLFDYVGDDAAVSFDENAEDVVKQRFEQITEHYQGRVEGLEAATFGAPPYKPVPPDTMFIDGAEWARTLSTRGVYRLSSAQDVPHRNVEPMGGRLGKTFLAERQSPNADLMGAVIGHLRGAISRGQRAFVACWTPGSRDRLMGLLVDRGFEQIRAVDTFEEARALPGHLVSAVVLGLERGFETSDMMVIGEQDILGDRFVRRKKARKKATDVITEAASLAVGDLVVHADHGIGRFLGLKTIEALGAPHDCMELAYHGGDRLYLPVENIELLSRYGSDTDEMQLDRLGGAAWQNRKARLKKRLREIADELIKVAALRQLRTAPAYEPPTGAFDEFVAKFPYEETDDQLASIDAVIEDLKAGKPMDRLVCGDVGFGKTEVAMRAAFVAAMAGAQVAVVVPTTLLARQHYRSFKDRFAGLPVDVAQASRLVGNKELARVREGLATGKIDIVVGTHALLSKSIAFDRLGLLIIDEEQRFGVNHKERLKKMREDVHVLTLSATPIPRTLQLALTGVRELSMITTPPVDRLAVRSYVSPFDPVILRDALRRERYRGGQTYFVVPRIADLEKVAEFLAEATPELRVAKAHGQLAPTELEDIMTAFYEGEYDVLLSTTIVESGLDVPNANTLIVYRADMFGLAQLYQLRGRVGRSKTRAYAYFTTQPGAKLTDTAEKRLNVLKSLDSLGAGFALASHDMDIRGGGNLLGEEQSGHIKEVGFELYQSMLEETISAIKGGELDTEAEDQWSPQIALGVPTVIPEDYVEDLQTRLSLYRRLSKLETREAIDEFAEEMTDRFGPMPDEVRGLLDVMEIKGLCRRAGIEKIDAGPKGAVFSFRAKAEEANPEALVRFLSKAGAAAKLQADHKLVVKGNWEDLRDRFKGTRRVLTQLAPPSNEPSDKKKEPA
jgi:transcription-repair coupling factor (superfamily II helicase)